ncbi:MAG: Asp-tRNA(Asn)/Glu-tRNA(Gln) amidotransferase subunit GatB [Chitinophagales bacterium]|nr:Asp-tRNA(Asn)/Glu-tRNA(Gln) amidotransferase subunit GatB [Chitinophagales bacterium]
MKLKAVIGLEIHVQLNTQSKIFSSDPNIFGEDPNTQISPISVGYPGTLPKLNIQALRKAIVMGIACHCDINMNSEFSRKHYFYPDLPKGYQITQHEESICKNGYIDLNINSGIKRIRFEKIHLEEDAGKSMHLENSDQSAIDLNRAGVPLIEMVTRPDLSTAEEAYQLLINVRRLVRYFGISDGDMEKGSLRCDANVSLREENSEDLRDKVEIKNLNSIRFVRNAIELEIKRQHKIYTEGGKIESHTRAYDDMKNITFPTRSKEMAHDYRYLPEPDLPQFILSQEFIEGVKNEMLPLPEILQKELQQNYELTKDDTELLIFDFDLLNYFRKAAVENNSELTMNWIKGPVKQHLNQYDIDIVDFPIDPLKLKGLLLLINNGDINHNIASKKIFPLMLKEREKTAKQIWDELNVEIKSDVSSLKQMVEQAVSMFPDKVEAYSNGKKGVVELFMGQVMKASKGTADPALSRKMIIETLNNKNSKK